jgi:GH35 family endo-1,4-beta-xylanase
MASRSPDDLMEGWSIVRNQFRLNSIRIAVSVAFLGATGLVVAERPTNPAEWPALKEVYKNHFLIGTTGPSAATYASTVVPGENSANAMRRKHFNAVTPENAMKPASLWPNGINGPTPGFLTNLTTGINNDLRAANEAGINVTGHVLIWHNQSNEWPAANVLTPEGRWETPWDFPTAKANLETYVTTVARHFDQDPFKLYAWDVVNEAFKDNPDNPADWRNALRTGYSPEERPARWAQAYSKGGKSWDYMYDAYFHARQNSTARLIYNDFNDNERASKAGAIAAMVKEFNERYAAESAAGKGRVLLDANGQPRKLVEVIGTQGHLNMRLNLDAFERTIKTYLDIGVDVDITELEAAPMLGLDKAQRIQNGPEMNDIFMAQGVYYAKMFNLLKDYARGPAGKNPQYPGGVHRVSWWGLTDPGYHTNGYLWSGVGQPKEAYWAVANPDQYLNEAGLPVNGVTATFTYGGETFTARTWGGKNAYASLDINVPAGTSNVAFNASNVSLPAGYVVESIKYSPSNCAVIPGKPCIVTVKARGADPAPAYKAVGVENTATYVLSFGNMAVSWFENTGSVADPFAFAEVRFSDGVTRFKQHKLVNGADGVLRPGGATEVKAVPKHGRSVLTLNTQERITNPTGLRLNKDAMSDRAWRLVNRIEPGRTYMVVSADSQFQDGGEIKAYALTNRTKPATPTAPESLSRTHVVLRGDVLVPQRNSNAPASEPALAQDNLKFMLEASSSPAAGPYAQQDGYTMESFIHGTNVYPNMLFRGNGATGTVVGENHSLITRQQNGAEGTPVADRVLDQAVWFHTPINPVTGATKMFQYTGRDATQQHYVLKEVDTGTTPNRDAGNAISQRQGATGGFVAMRAAGPEAGTTVKLFAHDLKAYVFGDVNGDLAVNCSDMSAASASVGKRAGQAGFSVGADIDQNGVIDVRDISGISRLLPAGTRC